MYKLFTYLHKLLKNLESLLQKISNWNFYRTLLLSDYSARNKKWWHHDITITEWSQSETITTIQRLLQLIDDPHICKNSSSCINLIFMNQPNLIVKSGIHPLFFVTIVNTKLTFLMSALELNTLHIANAMSGVIQKLTLME